MQVTLLTYTQLNPNLDVLSPVLRGIGTPQENLVEYAGRICYRSDDKMGRNPAFVEARVREGHEDIIEHVRFVFRLDDIALDPTLLALANLPTVEYTELGDNRWVVSLNARNIRDLWIRTRAPLAAEMMRAAFAVMPSVYRDVDFSGEDV